jgi:site-specific recombinase XerD
MGANLASISESMGHSNLKTTEAYFDSFGKEERIKNSALLPKRNKI